MSVLGKGKWVALGLLSLGATAAGAQEGAVPLYQDLGTHHYAISTRSPEAQRYFDQGLRLTYAFNHGEAIRSFTEAARLDPSCAMCYWGIALAYGPNINAPMMDEPSSVAAFEALQGALQRASGASPKEQALIQALTRRYTNPPPGVRAPLDSAYANAMRELARANPDDLDISTLYAESLMDLTPWNYWTPGGTPLPGTEDIVPTLERVLARNANHPGACHFYIHAVEAAHPEKAVACAERLAGLMPGAGHLVHMPAHIYIRVGRWNDAIQSNIHAVHRDEEFIADQQPQGLYPLAYYPHNYHFLSFAATMAGRGADAIQSARAVVGNVDPALAKDVPELQGLVPYLHLVLVRFGRWDEVLNTPMPSRDLPISVALAEYARGVSFAAKGNWTSATSSLQRVNQLRATVSMEPAHTIMDIAYHALAGEIDSRRGRLETGIGHLQEAMKLEDALPYTEPPYWYSPVRHQLGNVLLKAGRAVEAEAIYRQDLERFPENGWSLTGLVASLRAQQKTADAAAAQQRLDRVWSQADVTPTGSAF